MSDANGFSRRDFLKKGAIAAGVGAAGVLGLSGEASAKSGIYATLIDLTRCDGCKGETMPRCVEACRRVNEKKFPNPEQPIKDLWPQKTHDDWSRRRDVIDALTPYNWITVQMVKVDGRDLFIPRRCMHCNNPPCANLCPFGALNKYQDGSVAINANLCLGGAKCKTVCPWHIPQRQSGVGLYLKLQPMPAGGGVMYKCDLCHDRIRAGLVPACVEACERRLGSQRPLYFGQRDQISRMAHRRASVMAGSIYGEEENGGTATLYVSQVPFERIDAELRKAKSGLTLARVRNPLDGVNRFAKAFVIGPMVSALAAAGLVLFRRREETKEGQ
jgi:Fe-S-cluster-containing dehydrogenase component